MALPLGFGITALGSEPAWSDDVAIVRDVGLVSIGSEGAISTLLTQLFALLPVGGHALRAGLVGVIALGCASRLAFEAMVAWLDREGRDGLATLLAAFGSCIWALAPDVLDAAIRPGGPLLALALALLAQRLATEAFELGEAWALAATGLVLAATLSEDHAAGCGLALLLLCTAGAERRGVWRRGEWRLYAALGGGLLLFGSLRMAAALADPALPDLTALAQALAAPLSRARALGVYWCAQLGVVPVALGGCGAAIALLRRRRQVWPWALCCALGIVSPLQSSGAPGALGALLSSLGAAAFFALGASTLVRAFWASRLPLGRPAAVLSAAFAATLVLTRVDRAALRPPFASAAPLWTDAALARLPQDSLLIVQSPELARRLLAAGVLGEARPDVTLVPSALLATRIGADPQLSERRLAPLLRQLWVNGSPDEYSLSHLADQRPVWVELDPSWDRRVLEHLRPEGPWLRFLPNPLGAAERRAAVEDTRAALRSVVELGGGIEAFDPSTRRVLGESTARQAWLLAALGENDGARRLLRTARHLDPQNRLARGTARELAGTGRVAVSELSR
jgi:hypothetical protein